MSGLSPNKTQEQVDDVMYRTTIEALKGGVVGLAAGLAGGLVLYRASSTFRNISIPYKAFLLSSSCVAGIYIAGDRYMIQESRPFLKEMEAESKAAPLTARGWLRENRFSVIGVSWLASMAGALAYSLNERNIKMSQKLVHARVYAQAATVAVLLATAVAAQMDDEEKPVEKPDIKFMEQINRA